MSALPLIPVGRKSSGEDPELSRARQEAATRRWAEAEGEELAPFVWEANVSGSKRWRDRGLGEALAAVERGEAAGIVVEEQSRLSRENMLATAEVWDALEKAGARLVCTAEGIDTAKGDHELSFAIRAALAREQWKQYARRMADVKCNRIAAGIFIGPAPTGYVKGADGKLAVDPAMGQVVRELFELRAAGSSWGDLLKHADARTGRTWTQPGIAGIIRNRVYLGDLVYGELVNEGAHEGIVDAPLWHAAQRRGKEPNRSGPRSKWLLSGLVTCGSCEHSMIVWRGASERGGKAQAPQRRYRCTNRACSKHLSADAPRLEAWTLDTVWTLLGSRVKDADDPIDLSPLVEAAATAERRLEQSLAPEAQDALGDRWAATVKERRATHEDAQAELGLARQRVEVKTAELLDLRDRWDELTPEKQRETLAVYLIERVVVKGTGPSSWELVLR